MTLESELRHAIDTEELVMFYQPIVDSATYATAGFESLVRWPHPTRGLLTPGQFLGVAEEAGLVSRLDTVALKKTCSQMARWAARYPLANELYVSANKVPKNFPQFVQQIREIVASTGLPPGLLVVEVVESTHQASLGHLVVLAHFTPFVSRHEIVNGHTRYQPVLLARECTPELRLDCLFPQLGSGVFVLLVGS